MTSLDLMKSSEVRKAADQFKYLKYVQEHVRCRQAQAQPPRLYIGSDSSEKRSFWSTQKPREMLQNCYVYGKRKPMCFFFRFSFKATFTFPKTFYF